jgi:hypothetical protein
MNFQSSISNSYRNTKSFNDEITWRSMNQDIGNGHNLIYSSIRCDNIQESVNFGALLINY